MNRRIFRLAIPNILSNVSVPLLGLVDTALMGHLESSDYLEAIALGGAIFSFLYWSFGFIRMGTTGLTAQALGKGARHEGTDVLGRGLLVAFGAGIAMILLQYPIAEGSFWIMEGGEGVKALGKEYFYIRIYGAPASLGLFALQGWFLGMQNARIPMLLALVVNLANIGFNLLFLYGFGMRSEGVALGTVIAQYLGLLLAIGAFVYYYRDKAKGLKWADIVDTQALKAFFSLNTDIFLRTLCLVFVLNFMTAISGSYGDQMIAVNSILLQLNYLMAYGVDGFASAAESLVGLYVGKSKMGQMRKAVKYLMAWGMGVGLLFSLAYLFFDREIYGLLTNLPEVLDALAPYKVWIVLLPVISAAAFIWDGVYLGATASRPLRDTVAIAAFVVFLPAWYLSRDMGNHGLWLAFILFTATRSLLLTLLAKKKIFGKS